VNVKRYSGRDKIHPDLQDFQDIGGEKSTPYHAYWHCLRADLKYFSYQCEGKRTEKDQGRTKNTP